MIDFLWNFDSGKCINPRFYNSLECFSQDCDNIIGMTRAIDSVDVDQNSFVPFELSLSAEDRIIINNLKTNYNYYGQSGKLSELEYSISRFISSLSENFTTALSKNIIKNINYMLKASGYEYMNLKINVGDGYPGWHIDKAFDEVIGGQNEFYYSDYSHSFIFTLKGNPTRFISTNNEIRQNFLSKVKEYDFTYEANEGLNFINNASVIIEEQAAIFMRSTHYGSIHSTPDSQNRIVFVISPLIEKTSNLLNQYFDDVNSRFVG